MCNKTMLEGSENLPRKQCVMTKCSFIGLGVMGYHMAGHLAAHGNDVTVWNRTASKPSKWAADVGIRPAL